MKPFLSCFGGSFIASNLSSFAGLRARFDLRVGVVDSAPSECSAFCSASFLPLPATVDFSFGVFFLRFAGGSAFPWELANGSSSLDVVSAESSQPVAGSELGGSGSGLEGDADLSESLTNFRFLTAAQPTDRTHECNCQRTAHT